MDKMDSVFSKMIEAQKEQQDGMLTALANMQSEMFRQQVQFEKEAQKAAQEHELKLLQVKNKVMFKFPVEQNKRSRWFLRGRD